MKELTFGAQFEQKHLQGDVYSIIDQPYDRDIERWQFKPGDDVICELIDASDGPILAATRPAH